MLLYVIGTEGTPLLHILLLMEQSHKRFSRDTNIIDTVSHVDQNSELNSLIILRQSAL